MTGGIIWMLTRAALTQLRADRTVRDRPPGNGAMSTLFLCERT
jgi:hypothetical protein